MELSANVNLLGTLTALVECPRASWHELQGNKQVFIPLEQKTPENKQSHGGKEAESEALAF